MKLMNETQVSPGVNLYFAWRWKQDPRNTTGVNAYHAWRWNKMQEMGESHASPSTQLHAMRRPRSGAGSAPRSDSLGALTLSGKRNGLNPSLSLPALPKGLANSSMYCANGAESIRKSLIANAKAPHGAMSQKPPGLTSGSAESYTQVFYKVLYDF